MKRYKPLLHNKKEHSESEISKIFINSAKKIWSGFDTDSFNLTVKITQKYPETMVLTHKKNAPKKIKGNELIEYPKDVTLYVNPRSFDLDSTDLKNLIAHESIHIGITDHDKNFQKLADKHNIPVSEMGLKSDDSGKFQVQIKVKDGKYDTLKGFDNEKDAELFIQKMSKGNNGEKSKYKIKKNT